MTKLLTDHLSQVQRNQSTNTGGKTNRSGQTYRSSMSPSKLASLGDDLSRN